MAKIELSYHSLVINIATTLPQLYHNSTTTLPQFYHNSTTTLPQLYHNSTTTDNPITLTHHHSHNTSSLLHD
eukprot:11197821-Ditylum_brightwellii.AAC.1